MSKTKPFQFTYQVEAEKLEQVIGVIFEQQQISGMEPTHLTLPTGEDIPWNAWAAQQFAAEGRIDEKEFIEISKTQNNIRRNF